MKILFCTLLIGSVLLGCTLSKPTIAKKDQTIHSEKDTIRIANDTLQYEVIIIDTGFSSWLASKALPRGYYSQNYLENKNRIYINEFNNRVIQPMRDEGNLYNMTIEFNPNTNYGYEVNYLIFNYMIYFQNKYKQKLDGYVPIR